MVFDKLQIPLIAGFWGWAAFLNGILNWYLTMSHLSDTTDWAWNMTPALFPVNKTVKYRDEWKRPFSSLCIWTPIFTKWLENEVQNTFKNRTRLVCPSLHEPALPKRGRLLPPGGAGRGGGTAASPTPNRPPWPRPLARAPAANPLRYSEKISEKII